MQAVNELEFLDVHTHGQFNSLGVKRIKSLSLLETRQEQANEERVTAGIHPWWLEELSNVEIEELKYHISNMARQGKLWAIGETGLDRLYPEFLEAQIDLFIWHRDLARDYALPLIIHSVRAASDFQHLLKRYPPETPWIFHDYRGSFELTQSLLKLHPDCYFSFGLSLDNSAPVRDLIKSIPLDHLFLETDNQKHLDIQEIFLRAAELLQVDINYLKSQTWANFKKITPALQSCLS